MVSLQLISATSAYPLLPAQVVSICDLQRLVLSTGPRARTATGQRSFAVNGTATWNRLPPALRTTSLCGQALWEVTRAVLAAQLLYARPAWSGFLKADEISQLQMVFIARCYA